MKYISTWDTVRNSRYPDKPNEDFVLCDDERSIYILVDGVSRDRIDGKYPNPSPSREASRIFAETTYQYLKETDEADPLEQIKKAYQKGNEAVAAYNREFVGYFLPGTVGIVCRILENRLYYGYIGDCSGRIIRPDAVELFTQCQTAKMYQHRKEYTMEQIRRDICNHPEHPYAYGVLSGKEEALSFVILGTCTLSKDETIVLASDGMEKYLAPLQPRDYVIREAGYYLEASVKGTGEDDKSLVLIYNMD